MVINVEGVQQLNTIQCDGIVRRSLIFLYAQKFIEMLKKTEFIKIKFSLYFFLNMKNIIDIMYNIY